MSPKKKYPTRQDTSSGPRAAGIGRNGYSSPRRNGHATSYSPQDARRRNIALGIIGAGVLITLLVLLYSVEQRSPAPVSQQATTDQASAGATIAGLQERLKQNPGDVDAMISLGNTYYDAKFYTDAITWYEKALQKQPTNTDVRTDLGTAYFYSGQNDKAKEQWTKVLQQDPNKVQAHFNFGILYSSLNPPDNDAAAKEWQTVIKLAPGSPDATEAEKRLKQIGR